MSCIVRTQRPLLPLKAVLQSMLVYFVMRMQSPERCCAVHLRTQYADHTCAGRIGAGVACGRWLLNSCVLRPFHDGLPATPGDRRNEAVGRQDALLLCNTRSSFSKVAKWLRSRDKLTRVLFAPSVQRSQVQKLVASLGLGAR